MLKKTSSGNNHKKFNPKEKVQRSYADKIQDDLEKKGVEFFQPGKSLDIDENYLYLPSDLTDISGRDLGRYLNAYTQQKMYMRTLIGWCECMIEEARRKYMEVAISYYREANATKMSEKAKELEVTNNPEVLPFYEELQDIKMKKITLSFNLSSIEDAIFLISREISRRESDFGDETRNYNVEKR